MKKGANEVEYQEIKNQLLTRLDELRKQYGDSDALTQEIYNRQFRLTFILLAISDVFIYGVLKIIASMINLALYYDMQNYRFQCTLELDIYCRCVKC